VTSDIPAETLNKILSCIFDEAGKIDLVSLAGFVQTEFQPVTFNGVMYVYNEDTHLYEQDTGSVNQWVGNVLENASYAGLFSTKTPVLSIKKEIYRRVFDAGVIPGRISPFNKYPGVPVANGVIIFDEAGKVKLIDYTPEMLFTRQLPIDFDPNADHRPMLKVLSEWAGEDVLTLYQIPAQSIVQSLPDFEPFKRAYLLTGQGNSGKSSYLALLQKMFGEMNISGVALQDLAGRFNGSRLFGKFLNVRDDLQSLTLDSSENFKEYTGSRKHEVEMKYQHPFVADIHAVHIFSCNKPPEIGEKLDFDDGFWNRWTVVKFQNNFAVRPGWMRETFTKENLQGFFKQVVEIAGLIISDGGLLYEPDPSQVKTMWKEDSSPLLEFLDLYTERGPASYMIPKDELLTGLFRWIDDTAESEGEKQDLLSRSPRSKRDLTQRLFREGIDEARVGKKNAVESYRGVRWKRGCCYAPSLTENGVLV